MPIVAPPVPERDAVASSASVSRFSLSRRYSAPTATCTVSSAVGNLKPESPETVASATSWSMVPTEMPGACR